MCDLNQPTYVWQVAQERPMLAGRVIRHRSMARQVMADATPKPASPVTTMLPVIDSFAVFSSAIECHPTRAECDLI
jgi:hypothetical protein